LLRWPLLLMGDVGQPLLEVQGGLRHLLVHGLLHLLHLLVLHLLVKFELLLHLLLLHILVSIIERVGAVSVLGELTVVTLPSAVALSGAVDEGPHLVLVIQ
jgi:hypothetical protein